MIFRHGGRESSMSCVHECSEPMGCGEQRQYSGARRIQEMEDRYLPANGSYTEEGAHGRDWTV